MDLTQTTELTLERMARILETHGPERTAVAWSGGKDSTVVMALWRETLVRAGRDERPKAVSVDTGLKFPDVLAFRDRMAEIWGVKVYVARPDPIPPEYPVAEDPVTCCRDLKIVPLESCLKSEGILALLTGVRHDEHPARLDIPWQENRHGVVRAHVIHHWTEMDIWAFVVQEKLAYCPLYDQGYRSLGCRPCTALISGEGSERLGRSQAKESKMEELRSLGYF
ncbi:MAG: phosphoadenosine phosphosulfate reductase family protein [Deltaproteobacteria bacterium]|nr:phosphoadenosine phosphosulfate reductase family protein [Deltaproteobacteria bacterium]